MDQEGGAPAFFIKAVVSLEKYVENTFEDQKEKKAKGEKLNQNKALAFNTLRAKIKKGLARELAPYADDMQRMKDHPDEFESEAEEEEKSDASSESEASPKGKGGGSSSSSSSSSDSDSDSSSDSDSDSSSDSDSDSDSSGSDSYSSGSASDAGGDGDEEAAREKKMIRWCITEGKM